MNTFAGPLQSSRVRRVFAAACAAAVLLLAACGSSANQSRMSFKMGEKMSVGPFTYTVLEAKWATQLGDGLRMRIPEQRFLMLRLSVTNGGGKEVSLPLLTLEDGQTRTFQELSNGEGVNGWFGFIRTVQPAQTEEGWILFDVPTNSYELRVTDGGEPGSEQSLLIEIPLTLGTDDTFGTAPAPATPAPLR